MTINEYRNEFKCNNKVRYQGELYRPSGLMTVRRNGELITSVRLTSMDGRTEYWVSCDAVEKVR